MPVPRPVRIATPRAPAASASTGFEPSARRCARCWLRKRAAGSRAARSRTDRDGELRYDSRQSPRRVFFMGLSAAAGSNLDADRQLLLGGDNGLRGYPLRYQAGSKTWLFTAEQRMFSNWFPFQLFNVGGAVFFDMGQALGHDPLGSEPRGLLRDVGFGLRFGNNRSALGNVLHVDFAFPLDRDASIRSMQVLVEPGGGFEVHPPACGEVSAATGIARRWRPTQGIACEPGDRGGDARGEACWMVSATWSAGCSVATSGHSMSSSMPMHRGSLLSRPAGARSTRRRSRTSYR